MTERWHQDSDHWVWRVYDGPELNSGAVSQKTGEDTTDIYIIPHKNEWWIVDAKSLMDSDGGDWIQRVSAGEGVRIAGPFIDAKSAKAAWRVMYG